MIHVDVLFRGSVKCLLSKPNQLNGG